jgi:hypothetical protein
MDAGDYSIISPQYRGFKLVCVGSEIERLKRAVDEFWADAYQQADSPAGRVQVLMAERAQRDAPLDWTGAKSDGKPPGER